MLESKPFPTLLATMFKFPPAEILVALFEAIFCVTFPSKVSLPT